MRPGCQASRNAKEEKRAAADAEVLGCERREESQVSWMGGWMEMGWDRWVGMDGIGVDNCGRNNTLSGPGRGRAGVC